MVAEPVSSTIAMARRSGLRANFRWNLALAILLAPHVCFSATPDQVENAIERAKAHLYEQQNAAGHWEADMANAHIGGYTAMATYALLASGEVPQDPRVEAGIKWLVKSDIGLVYALGLRAQVWTLVPMTED